MNTDSVQPPDSKRKRPFRLRFHSAVRWLHTYTSLISLFLVLFFSVTGVTLNHPEWTFGTSETTHSYSGKLELTWVQSQEPDWLQISDFLRKTHGLKGPVSDRTSTESDGSLIYKAPGYSADVFFNRTTGNYDVKVVAYGPISILNDLHKGRDVSSAGKWMIDVSGVILIFISLTGLIMLFYLKKIKMKGLAAVIFGSAASIWLLWWLAQG